MHNGVKLILKEQTYFKTPVLSQNMYVGDIGRLYARKMVNYILPKLIGRCAALCLFWEATYSIWHRIGHHSRRTLYKVTSSKSFFISLKGSVKFVFIPT